jgi:hypothetical protein
MNMRPDHFDRKMRIGNFNASGNWRQTHFSWTLALIKKYEI